MDSSHVQVEMLRLRSLTEYPSASDIELNNSEPLVANRLSREQKIAVALGYMRDARLAPADLMIHVLNPQSPELDRYRVGLYKEGGKLGDMMNVIMSDPRGKERLREWMQPHAVDATCAIVDREMELVKARLSIPMNLVNPEFINKWSLESTTGQAAIELAPVLLRVLERAAESDRAQSKNKKKSSEQVRTAHSIVRELLIKR